jgi:hypothetical protein
VQCLTENAGEDLGFTVTSSCQFLNLFQPCKVKAGPLCRLDARLSSKKKKRVCPAHRQISSQGCPRLSYGACTPPRHSHKASFKTELGQVILYTDAPPPSHMSAPLIDMFLHAYTQNSPTVHAGPPTKPPSHRSAPLIDMFLGSPDLNGILSPDPCPSLWFFPPPTNCRKSTKAPWR